MGSPLLTAQAAAGKTGRAFLQGIIDGAIPIARKLLGHATTTRHPATRHPATRHPVLRRRAARQLGPGVDAWVLEDTGLVVESGGYATRAAGRIAAERRHRHRRRRRRGRRTDPHSLTG